MGFRRASFTGSPLLLWFGYGFNAGDKAPKFNIDGILLWLVMVVVK